jgi:hypothetical protein
MFYSVNSLNVSSQSPIKNTLLKMGQELTEKKRLGITHGELLMASIVIISALLMFWKTTDVRLTALELRMNGADKTSESIMNKLDKVQESLNEVNLTLKDKQDRKQ